MVIQLIVSKSIKVEYDSLEMQNQNVRCFSNQNSLANIDFFIAAIALVVVNHLAFDLFG